MSNPRQLLEQALRERDQAFNALIAARDAAAGALLAAQEAHANRTQALIVEAASLTDAQPLFRAWDDPRWADWQPVPSDLHEVRIGSLRGFPEVAMSVPVFTGRTVIAQSESTVGAEAARVLLRSAAVRTSLGLGAGVTLHLLDPAREGFGFPERAVLPQARPSSADVDDQLEAVIEAGHAFQLRHPGRYFEQLSDAERLTTPRHVVVAMDFPRGYGYREVEAINRIAALSHAGIQMIVHHDLTADRTGVTGLDVSFPVACLVDGRGEVAGAWGALVAIPDAPPGLDQTRRLVDRLPTTTAASVGEQTTRWADHLSTDPGAWWQGSAVREIRSRVGVTADGRPVELAFGIDADDNSRPHAAVAGTSGRGKTTFVHAAILGFATTYRPDELRMFLVGGRNGKDLAPYARLPHADLVTLNTPLDVLAKLVLDTNAELDRRATLFTESRARGEQPTFTRLLVVLDEYQELFRAGDAEEATKALLRVAKEGRALGVHLMLVSQSFKPPGLQNRDELFNNIMTRVAFQLPAGAVETVTEFGSSGRAMIAAHCTERGRMVFNAEGGAEQANAAGNGLYADEELRTRVVGQLADKAAVEGLAQRPVVFDGEITPRLTDSRAVTALRYLDVTRPDAVAQWARSGERNGGLAATSWLAYDHPQPCLVGRSLTVFGSALLKVDRAPGQNVLAVMSDPAVLTGAITSGLATSALGTPSERFALRVLSELPPPGPWTGVLGRALVDELSDRGADARVAADGVEAGVLLEEALAEVRRREALSPTALAVAGPYWVCALGLDRLSAFRLGEDRYGGATPSPATQVLLDLLADGPSVGVHAVVGFTSPALLWRVLPRKARAQFEHRLVQQMSADDSRVLLDTGFANRVDHQADAQVRAGYANMQTGEESVFLPFIAKDGFADDLATILRRR
jgi:hypothetical protein